MNATVLVYMTAKDFRQAAKIAHALVKKSLVACVNILGPSRSIYRWKGKICDEREVAFIAKTRRGLLPKLVAAVKALHTYENPCIVALPITGGSREFLRWIESETRPVSPKRSRNTR